MHTHLKSLIEECERSLSLLSLNQFKVFLAIKQVQTPMIEVDDRSRVRVKAMVRLTANG